MIDPINHRIAARVRALRAGLGLTLEGLAASTGVSRSMLSLIERGRASPTAVVLEKLATGLGVTLASLFDTPEPTAGPVSRRAEQTAWRDPASGYVRRNLSPAGFGGPIRLVEVDFPAGARVTYESAPRPSSAHQQVWILEGEMEVMVGPAVHRLSAGDCLAMTLDQPVGFHNPGGAPARYLVAVASAR